MSGKVLASDLLGSTARWTAGVRALESGWEERLFEDSWAASPGDGHPGRSTGCQLRVLVVVRYSYRYVEYAA
jgi:hypothetical protein